MSYPCQDCGKVLATQGGLDVHRAQWCAGLTGGASGDRPGKVRRRDRRRQEREARRLRAVGPEPEPAGAGPVPTDVPDVSLFERAGWGAPRGASPNGHPGAPADQDDDDEGGIDLRTIDLRDEEERIELSLLMWLMRRRAHVARLPKERTLVRFNFTGSRTESYWLVIETPEVSLLSTEPRQPADVVVTADSFAFKRVFQGRMLLADALGDDLVRLEGPEPLVQSLPRWFEWAKPLATAGEQPV